jgi:hypothetical protein
MLRSYTAADALTIGNAACGTVAMFLCLDYLVTSDRRFLWAAFVLLPAALVCDVLDGYVARLNTTRQSRLGADLDSLSDIVSFARLFEICVDRVSGDGASEERFPKNFTRSVAIGILDRWAQACAVSFRVSEATGRSEEVRASAGLLASYALMFLWDHADGRRALRCENCSRYFVSNEVRAEYCSPRCRNTASVRRRRRSKAVGKGRDIE